MWKRKGKAKRRNYTESVDWVARVWCAWLVNWLWPVTLFRLRSFRPSPLSLRPPSHFPSHSRPRPGPYNRFCRPTCVTTANRSSNNREGKGKGERGGKRKRGGWNGNRQRARVGKGGHTEMVKERAGKQAGRQEERKGNHKRHTHTRHNLNRNWNRKRNRNRNRFTQF